MQKFRIPSFVFAVLLAVSLSACGLKPQPTARPTAVIQSGGTQPTASTGDNNAQPTDSGPELPADVPLIEGAYNLQILRSGTQVNYQVNGSIENAVAFYQDNLPNFGWEMAGPPDSAVGAIASMLRKNADGDKISINMQFNPIGEFVNVTIAIGRAK